MEASNRPFRVQRQKRQVVAEIAIGNGRKGTDTIATSHQSVDTIITIVADTMRRTETMEVVAAGGITDQRNEKGSGNEATRMIDEESDLQKDTNDDIDHAQNRQGIPNRVALGGKRTTR